MEDKKINGDKTKRKKKEENKQISRRPEVMQYVYVCGGTKTVKAKCERLHRNEKRESKELWIGRLERSPVVCARWCSLIIHCMRWMSLSPHTAQLYSALCLSAPGSADEHRLEGYDIGL